MEQFAAAHRALLDTAKTVNDRALDGFEKLIGLQMQTARTAMEESVDHVRVLLESDEPAKVAEQNMAFMQPAGEKLVAYARHVYDIAAETNAGMAEALQRHFDAAQGQVSQWFEATVKDAPAGSEPIVEAARNAMGVAQDAYEQAVTASRKFAEFTDQNMAQAGKAVAAPRAAKRS
ncbi:MAG: phasin family protein [Burkholderiales bacterium]|nr:MAG: phasin family protein [Burkholderiales bacterium]